MSRPDRDSHINVLWDNILNLHVKNFNIESDIDSRGFEYDPYSIMHYGMSDFSKNGLQTIQFKDPVVNHSNVGQRGQLSVGDVEQTNSMYQCKACGWTMDSRIWRSYITEADFWYNSICEVRQSKP